MGEHYFLTANRLGFRNWNTGDLVQATSIWGDEVAARFTGGPLTDTQIHNRLITENRLLKIYNVQHWPMFRLETNEFVGCCGLHPYKPREKVYEMGIHVCKEYQGKGFATEAAHAVIEYAFADLGATALFASPHPDDVVAKKLLENLGFLHMGDVYSEPTRLPHPSYLLEKVNYCSYCLR